MHPPGRPSPLRGEPTHPKSNLVRPAPTPKSRLTLPPAHPCNRRATHHSATTNATTQHLHKRHLQLPPCKARALDKLEHVLCSHTKSHATLVPNLKLGTRLAQSIQLEHPPTNHPNAKLVPTLRSGTRFAPAPKPMQATCPRQARARRLLASPSPMQSSCPRHTRALALLHPLQPWVPLVRPPPSTARGTPLASPKRLRNRGSLDPTITTQRAPAPHPLSTDTLPRAKLPLSLRSAGRFARAPRTPPTGPPPKIPS